MKQELRRGDIWEIVLDPVKGSEPAGFRPCVIVSPDSMNDQLETVIVVPLTTRMKDWPTRVETYIDEVPGQAMCEQIRTISQQRLRKKIARLSVPEIVQIKLVLKQMFLE